MRTWPLAAVAVGGAVGAVGFGLWSRADLARVDDRRTALRELATPEVARRVARAWGPPSTGTPGAATAALGAGWLVRFPADQRRFEVDRALDVSLRVGPDAVRPLCVTLAEGGDEARSWAVEGYCAGSGNDLRTPYLRSLTTTTTTVGPAAP